MFWTCELIINTISKVPFLETIRVVGFEFVFACEANTRL